MTFHKSVCSNIEYNNYQLNIKNRAGDTLDECVGLGWQESRQQD